MEIHKVAVIGTGTMGHGIAQLCAQAGWEVFMFGRSEGSLERGFNSIRSSLQELIANNKLTQADADNILARIHGIKAIPEAVREVDLVVEAVAENLKLKQEIFKQLDSLCPPHVILASTTSGISPTAIAAGTRYPERVIVAHFWNPPQLLPLVEVVPGERTSDATVEATIEWLRRLGKEPVRLKKECLGFIGNRLQLALLREALYCVEQGWAEPAEVDKAVEYGFGRRLAVTGPLASADLGGLDVFYSIATYLLPDLCNSSQPSRLLREKVEAGDLGSKTGRGIYEWTPDKIQKAKLKRNKLLLYFLDEDAKRK